MIIIMILNFDNDKTDEQTKDYCKFSEYELNDFVFHRDNNSNPHRIPIHQTLHKKFP